MILKSLNSLIVYYIVIYVIILYIFLFYLNISIFCIIYNHTTNPTSQALLQRTRESVTYKTVFPIPLSTNPPLLYSLPTHFLPSYPLPTNTLPINLAGNLLITRHVVLLVEQVQDEIISFIHYVIISPQKNVQITFIMKLYLK